MLTALAASAIVPLCSTGVILKALQARRIPRAPPASSQNTKGMAIAMPSFCSRASATPSSIRLRLAGRRLSSAHVGNRNVGHVPLPLDHDGHHSFIRRGKHHGPLILIAYINIRPRKARLVECLHQVGRIRGLELRRHRAHGTHADRRRSRQRPRSRINIHPELFQRRRGVGVAFDGAKRRLNSRPILPASMCVLRINRHAPNPITAPPRTITPTMIATTIRIAFSAPPPCPGVAAGAAAMAGFAAAPAGLAAVVWKPEAPVIVAPQLVQNFPAPSSVAPHDVQNAMTHLSNTLLAEYIATSSRRERSYRRGFQAIGRHITLAYPNRRGSYLCGLA